MSHPFPSHHQHQQQGAHLGAFSPPGLGDMNKQQPHALDASMKIDIPREKEEQHHYSSPAVNRKQQQQQQQKAHLNDHLHSSNLAHTALNNSVQSLPLQSPASIAPHHDSNVAPPPRTSSIHSGNWVYHPRQPNSAADSYFPHSTNHLTQSHPVGSARGHSRQTSGAGLTPSAIVAGRTNKSSNHSMSLSLSGAGQQTQPDYGNYAGPQHNGPPSPSTLTDIILGLHSTLYGGKKTPEEVRERVGAFYDQDAIFESPLLQAKGREQIANQFIMAFTLPGMDVTSELRDVICSDFEFDGTRAGIIDQTISVTLLPALFGSQEYPPHSHHPTGAQAGYTEQHAGTSTPGYTLQSAGVTPHPYLGSHAHTPAGGFGSMFSRFTSSRPHSPTTPFSATWGSSRPHTPGAHHSSHIRPLSTSAHPVRPSTPPSVNGGDDDEGEYGTSHSTIQPDEASHFMTATEAGGGQVSRPQMPLDAVSPHWTSDGLGRASFRAILWGILHPRAVLKSLCTIHLRVMSRLEFNDAGHIVRHEDSWGLRETIEGTIPFASVVYALERRVVGYLCSFAIGKGFRLSSAITGSSAIGDPEYQHRQLTSSDGKYNADANDAARALLLGQNHYQRQEQLHSMARSRASSPSRHRFAGFSGHATPYAHTFSAAGTRSRARSLTGQIGQPIRAQSSENLLTAGLGYGDRERGMSMGGTESLPPDSSARYRGIRQKVSSTASAPVTIINNSLEHLWQNADTPEMTDSKSRAPDRDL